MRTLQAKVLAGAVIGISATAALALAPPPFTLDWFTIDNGGTMSSGDGRLALSGTIGQADAGGGMIGEGLELTGGFWFGRVPGDCNWDGGINLFDHEDFVACMGGPSSAPGPSFCPCLDLDGDRDVDLSDFAEFQRIFHGT